MAGREALTHGDLLRRPFWLGSASEPAAAWLHQPSSGMARPHGVLICPPVGFEYTHSHRTLVHLADELAGRGFVVLRLDYPGTGASFGDESLPGSVEGWVTSIREALALLERLTSGHASVIGLRIGALLAGQASHFVPVHRMVAWAPVVRGRRFTREVRALHGVTAGTSEPSDYWEAAGFRLSEQTARELGELDLLSGDLRIGAGALIVDRSDQPSAKPLVEHLAGLGIPTSSVEQDDYPDMVAEPQYTVVPVRVLSAIADWLSVPAEVDLSPVDGTVVEEIRRARSVTHTGGPVEFCERLTIVPTADGHGLFGVLTEPTTPLEDHSDTVVMVNSGSVHQVGPNRLYVEATRALARAGYRSLRFDLRNLGDSRIGPASEENHPYPGTAASDLRSVVSWLTASRRGSCIVVGLCSGAHASFHALRDDEDLPVARAIAINPLTFNFRPGMSLDTPQSLQNTRDAMYYGQAVLDPTRWKKLLTGRSDVGYIMRFALRRLVRGSLESVRALGRATGVAPRPPLVRDLRTIERLGRELRFVFAESDPGRELLKREGGATLRRLIRTGAVRVDVVSDSDHTFSKQPQRASAIAHVVRAARRTTLTRRFEPAGADLWERVSPCWESLLDQTANTSAFLSRTWTRHWVKMFGSDLGCRAIVWSNRRGADVACALISTGTGRMGPAKVSQTWLNTSGEASVGCEHNDILVLPPHRAEVVADLADVFMDIGSDEVSLVGVSGHLFEALYALWPVRRWDGFKSESPWVDLESIRSSDGTYLSSLSRNTRSQIRRGIRGLETLFGPPAVEVASSRSQALDWFGRMVALHNDRWRSEGEAGAFGRSASRFHYTLLEQVMTSPADRDLSVDVVRVRFGDTPVGYLYNLVCDGHVHFYQAGFGHRDLTRLKPGLVCHALTIEYCLKRGDLEYDFLGGEAEPVQYKRSLSNASRTLYWAQLPAPSLKMRSLNAARHIRRRMLRAEPG